MVTKCYLTNVIGHHFKWNVYRKFNFIFTRKSVCKKKKKETI